MGLLLLLINFLKIIGIILIILIVFVLILLCFIIFVPIKYNVYAEKYQNIEIKIIFTWFLKLLKYKVDIKDGYTYKQFKLAEIILWDNNKKEPKKLKNKKNNYKQHSKEVRDNTIENKSKQKNKNNIKNKSEINFNKKVKNKIDNKKSKENLDYLKNIFNKIKSIFKYPERDIIIKYTKKLILKLFKIIKPENINIKCEFGFDDPSITGYLLGVISMMSVLIPGNLNIKGNFEKEIFNISLETYGKANLWSIGFHILVYVFKKPIWKLIKNRKEDI